VSSLLMISCNVVLGLFWAYLCWKKTGWAMADGSQTDPIVS